MSYTSTKAKCYKLILTSKWCQYAIPTQTVTKSSGHKKWHILIKCRLLLDCKYFTIIMCGTYYLQLRLTESTGCVLLYTLNSQNLYCFTSYSSLQIAKWNKWKWLQVRLLHKLTDNCFEAKQQQKKRPLQVAFPRYDGRFLPDPRTHGNPGTEVGDHVEFNQSQTWSTWQLTVSSKGWVHHSSVIGHTAGTHTSHAMVHLMSTYNDNSGQWVTKSKLKNKPGLN